MNDNILLVDDDPGANQLLGRILSGKVNLRFATSGAEALRLACESTPDLILLDAEKPGMSGFQVCKALKADASMADVSIIFITSHSETAFEVAGFELGAADFISKPVDAAIVRARVETQLRHKRALDELRKIAGVDVLTSVANRRSFGETLDRECRRAQRSGEPMAVLMIDVDHFKSFNDRHGHSAGDACLRAVATALRNCCFRPADLVARYGGEEFVMLLPQTSRRGAEFMANRVLDRVEGLDIPHETSLTARHVSVSVGVACYDSESASWASPSVDSRFADDTIRRAFPTEMVRAAGNALYSAKQAGRAQAKLLDIADVRAPQVVRDVARSRARDVARSRAESCAAALAQA